MTLKVNFIGYSNHKQLFHQKCYLNGSKTYIFRLQTEGQSVAKVNGKTMRISKGDLLFIKPRDSYELIVDKDFPSGDLHILCEGKWVSKWWSQNIKSIHQNIWIDDFIVNLWNQLIMEERRPHNEKDPRLANYLFKALCLQIGRAIKQARVTNRPHVVTKMVRYIEENALSPLKIEEIANHVGLSASRASHLFKDCVGKTIIEYALEIRLEAAVANLKYSSMSLDQIASSCGFGTYNYFYKVFKSKYKVSPGTFRRN